MKVRFRIIVTVIFTLLAVACIAKQPVDTSKNLHGYVLDSNDHPLSGASVFLKVLKSKAVKTDIVDKDGAYRFLGLDPNLDFQLWAEYNGVKSDVKNISSLDTRTDVEVKLHIVPAK